MYGKKDGTWKEVFRYFKKVNGSWTEIQESQFLTSIDSSLVCYGGTIRTVSNTLVIEAPATYIGKTFYCTCKYANVTVGGTWTLTSGSQYATITSAGKVTINEGVSNQNITVQCTYKGDTETKTVNVSYDNQLVIEYADTMSGTSGNAIARYNSTVVSPTWSITSGNAYATVSQNGSITITGSGTITLQAVYSGYTTAKTIVLQYVANQSTTTEVGEDGSVTTTTTTTTTDPDTGATITNTTSETTNDDGTTSSTVQETTTNTDGSSTSTSTTTNSDGTTSENTTNTNSDGSGTSTTTNYNENGDPTSGSTANTDTSGNVNTQDVEYDENGNSTVTGYTINTSDNQNGGENISGGLDTGFIAFDGRPFTIHMVCNVNPTEQPASGASMFLAALEHNGNRYAGFCVDLYKRNQVVSMASTSGSINNNGFGSRVTGSINGSSGQQLLQYVKTNGGVQTLTIDITYTPASYSPQYKYVITVSPLYTSATGTSKKTAANSTLSSNSGYLPESLSNATVVVGSFGVEHTHDMTNLEVLEFEVRKI
jgi:hypothetical protein